MTPQIWLGDLLRAIAAAPDEDRGRLAAALGLVDHIEQDRGEAAEELDGEPVSEAEPDAPSAAAQDADLQRKPDVASQEETAVPMLPVLATRPPIGTDWDLEPSLPAPTEENLTALPPTMPLLAPRTAAAVLYALLANRSPDGAIDIDELVRQWALRKPITRLPRNLVRTLRFGTQVLVDIGEGMELFDRDQDDLVQQIRLLVGEESTNVEYFADSPLRGSGPGPAPTWCPYRPPTTRSRVLIVSDFGIGGPTFHLRRSRPADWRSMTSRIRKAGCAPVGLLPYPPSRWPSWLISLMPLLTWDRSATAGRAAASVR